MVTDKLKELAAARAKLAALEQQINQQLNKELAGLPAKYNFGTVNEFVAAVEAANRGTSTPSRRGRRPVKAPTVAKKTGGRRRRAKITDETRAQVKKLVGEGKTGAEIAKAVGISLPSVQNIKKALGLVQKRK